MEKINVVHSPNYKNYFAMPTLHIFDKSLSLSAKGLLTEIMSLKKCSLTAEDIISLNGEPAVFEELLSAGYITLVSDCFGNTSIYIKGGEDNV